MKKLCNVLCSRGRLFDPDSLSALCFGLLVDSTEDDLALCWMMELIADVRVDSRTKLFVVAYFIEQMYSTDHLADALKFVASLYQDICEPNPKFIVKLSMELGSLVKTDVPKDLIFDASKVCLIPSSEWGNIFSQWDPVLAPKLILLKNEIRAYAIGLQVLRISTSLYFSWSIPWKTGIEAIIEFSQGNRILDIGAGRGLWSSILEAKGCQTVAVDLSFFNGFIQSNSTDFFQVRRMRQDAIIQEEVFLAQVLLLGWIPPEASSCFASYIDQFDGSIVIFLDDGNMAHTRGSEVTSALARNNFTLEFLLDLPHFPGFKSLISVFRHHEFNKPNGANSKK